MAPSSPPESVGLRLLAHKVAVAGEESRGGVQVKRPGSQETSEPPGWLQEPCGGSSYQLGVRGDEAWVISRVSSPQLASRKLLTANSLSDSPAPVNVGLTT